MGVGVRVAVLVMVGVAVGPVVVNDHQSPLLVSTIVLGLQVPQVIAWTCQ